MENICFFPPLKVVFLRRNLCLSIQEILLALALIGVSSSEFQGGKLRFEAPFCCFCKKISSSPAIFVYSVFPGNVFPWGFSGGDTSESERYQRTHSKEQVIFHKDKSALNEQLLLNAENHVTRNKRFSKKLVTWLYFIVDIIVFMTAKILLLINFWFNFWPVFSHIWNEHGDLLCKFPYSHRMRENTDPKNSE